MFLLASENSSGAYAVVNADGDHVLFLFEEEDDAERYLICLLYTSPSPRDVEESRMPSSA